MGELGFLVDCCQNCSGRIEFPSEGIGVEIDCPHCSSKTVLTGEPPSAVTPVAEISAAELKETLNQLVPRRPISVFYQLGLVLVALFMILLPVAYVAFIAMIAWGVYWYAIHARFRVLKAGFMSPYSG